MFSRIQRLLRSWGSRLARPLRGSGSPERAREDEAAGGKQPGSREGLEGAGGRQQLTRQRSLDGEGPTTPFGGVPAVQESPGLQFAREIGNRARLGVVRRTIHHVQRLRISRPRLPLYRVVPGQMHSVSRSPLPLVGRREGAFAGEGPVADDEAAKDAAWEALWRLRGTPRTDVPGESSSVERPAAGRTLPSSAQRVPAESPRELRGRSARSRPSIASSAGQPRADKPSVSSREVSKGTERGAPRAASRPERRSIIRRRADVTELGPSPPPARPTKERQIDLSAQATPPEVPPESSAETSVEAADEPSPTTALADPARSASAEAVHSAATTSRSTVQPMPAVTEPGASPRSAERSEEGVGAPSSAEPSPIEPPSATVVQPLPSRPAEPARHAPQSLRPRAIQRASDVPTPKPPRPADSRAGERPAEGVPAERSVEPSPIERPSAGTAPEAAPQPGLGTARGETPPPASPLIARPALQRAPGDGAREPPRSPAQAAEARGEGSTARRSGPEYPSVAGVVRRDLEPEAPEQVQGSISRAIESGKGPPPATEARQRFASESDVPPIAAPVTSKPHLPSTPLVRPRRPVPPRQPIGGRLTPAAGSRPIALTRARGTTGAAGTGSTGEAPPLESERPPGSGTARPRASGTAATMPVSRRPSAEVRGVDRLAQGDSEVEGGPASRSTEPGVLASADRDLEEGAGPAASRHPPRRTLPMTETGQARRAANVAPSPLSPVMARPMGGQLAHELPLHRPASSTPVPPAMGELRTERSLTSESAAEPVAEGPIAGVAAVQRAVLGPQDLRQAMQPRLAPVAVPTVIQAAASAPAGEEATSAAEEGGRGEGQDLESLARQVYRIIRRRIAVERERERGRL